MVLCSLVRPINLLRFVHFSALNFKNTCITTTSHRLLSKIYAIQKHIFQWGFWLLRIFLKVHFWPRVIALAVLGIILMTGPKIFKLLQFVKMHQTGLKILLLTIFDASLVMSSSLKWFQSNFINVEIDLKVTVIY